MPPPILTEEDHAFIREWRPHQTVSCLAQAIGTYYEIVWHYCRKYHLDGPGGRVTWLARDYIPGRRGPKPPRRLLSTMPEEAATFLRTWYRHQSLPHLAAAVDLPLKKVTSWCYYQKLKVPRDHYPAWHNERAIRWEVADLCDADRAFLLAERPRFYLEDLADMVGVAEMTVMRICREAKVWGPKYHRRRHR